MAVGALVVTAIAAAVSTYSSIKQGQAAKRASRAQKEASDVSAAQQRVEEANQRREQIRKQRIRTAQIEQSASNTGTSGSSGELGSLSALSTNSAGALAMMSGRSMAAQGIGDANQEALNQQSKGQTWASVGNIASAIGSIGMQAGAVKGAQSLFGSGTTASGLGGQVDNMMLQNPDLF